MILVRQTRVDPKILAVERKDRPIGA